MKTFGELAETQSLENNAVIPTNNAADTVSNKITFTNLKSQILSGISGAGSVSVTSGTNGNIVITGSGSGGSSTDTSKLYSTDDLPEATLSDDDKFPFYDVSVTGKRNSAWSNIKSRLKDYFDTIYSSVTSRLTPSSSGTDLSLVNTGDMYKWNAVSNTSNYSTNIQEIGTWIDGSTLYQKTFTGTLPNSVGTHTIDTFTYADKVKEMNSLIYHTPRAGSVTDSTFVVPGPVDISEYNAVFVPYFFDNDLCVDLGDAYKGTDYIITVKFTMT